MCLSERKIKILNAIITDYINTGEPIGSRSIAKKYNLGISSATIRNEMSDLEDLGLIIQPHTSSGRIPSDKGYRFYVDNFMNQKELTKDESDFIKEVISTNISHIDYLMTQTAKALSLLTKYTTVISKPKVKKDKVKSVQLVNLYEKTLLLVLIKESKKIKNIILEANRIFSQEELLVITSNINNILNTTSIEKIEMLIHSNEQKTLSENEEIIIHILKNIIDVMKNQEETTIYTSGVKNILDFPEFNDIEKAKNIFQTFEEKDILINIFGNTNNIKNNKIEILIGDENSIQEFKNCSIIKTEYKIENAIGTIGIIAPTRMDYAKAIGLLNGIIKNINDVIKGNSLE